jgi:L-gulonolactone oxidase
MKSFVAEGAWGRTAHRSPVNWAGNQRDGHHCAGLRDTGGSLMLHGRSRGGMDQPPAGHSFTDIARTGRSRLELTELDTDVRVDTGRRLVTVPAGMTLRVLNDLLARHALALPNLGDIDAQTVAGAISTGTHGTGARLGGLATFVTALTLVTGTGEVLHCSAEEHSDVFAAARVGLGALGVLVEVTLRCVDAFTLRAHERPAPLHAVLDRIPDLVSTHDHVEFYWFPYTGRVQVKTNDRVPADDRPLPRLRGWLDDGSSPHRLRRRPAARPDRPPWYRRSAPSRRALTERSYTGRSDRVFCTPRRVRFVEMEYALPRAVLGEALAALRGIVDRLPFKVLFPVEVRFTAADDIWLSHSYGRDSVYLAVHQYAGLPYEPYFTAFEQVARELDGRPHWGKLHYRDAASLAPAYPRFPDFLAIRDRLDPHRVFTNPYLDRVLGR